MLLSREDYTSISSLDLSPNPNPNAIQYLVIQLDSKFIICTDEILSEV